MKGKLIYGIATIGEGVHRSSNGDGKNTNLYGCWRSMLQRCYDTKYHKKRPTYKGCTVCEDWLNFQNFAKWALSNGFKVGLHLDKDIKGCGKIYSPENCLFVTNKQNNHALTKRRRSDNTTGYNGVGYHNKRKSFRARIKVNGVVKNLGWFKTFEEAKQARVNEENKIKNIV